MEKKIYLLTKRKMSYIPNPKLFTTGFLCGINKSTEVREKQGLPSQQSAGICYIKPTGSAGFCGIYPTPVVDVNYGKGSIPNNCPCTKFVQPP